MTDPSLPLALVAGDIVRDAHLYGGIKTSPSSQQEPGTLKAIRPGGAALSQELLAAAADHRGRQHDRAVERWRKANQAREAGGKAPLPRPDDLPEERPAAWHDCRLTVEIGATEEDRFAFLDRLPAALHSFGVWTPHPAEGSGGEPVWRVATHFGYGPGLPSGVEYPPCSAPVEAGRAPAVILIDDGGIAFRHERCREAWSLFERRRDGEFPWIVLKMSAPLCRGELPAHLGAIGAQDRLIVVVSADDLRDEHALIRRRLSWEQTVNDTLRALRGAPFREGLLSAAHLVVSFGSAAALWIERDGPNHLIFDPASLEGDFKRRYQGSVYGFQTTLAVSVVHHLARATEDRDEPPRSFARRMELGLMAGLAAKRLLVRVGHGKVSEPGPGFPIGEIARCLAHPPGGYVHSLVPSVGETEREPGWTILSRKERVEGSGSGPEPLIGLAELTARFGLGALSDVPSFAADKLFTVDRREIESLRTLETLIRNYEAQKVQEKPLSIGVFGPPGAGKSFAVKALAKANLGKEVPILEFNLSQFKDPQELAGAFHRVRDEVLRGRTPVAFWDEFDSQKFKWLQYLLAPMQDGAFQDGQITHPIGKCAFVFAGGTSASFAEFEARKPERLDDEAYLALSPDRRLLQDRKLEFQALKGPDFASRLHGHLDVLGPNPGREDVTWPIRRALMLRGVLRLKPNEALDIDPGLLRALLSVEKYHHGSRSLEKVVLALRDNSRRGRLVPSALPPVALLDQETDAGAFQEILSRHRLLVDHEDIERLAEAVHQNYLKTGQDIPAESNCAYAELSEDKKAANRAAARRIPDQLALVNGWFASRTAVDEDLGRRSREELGRRIQHHEERLAMAEHLGWMAERRANGWIYDSVRDDGRKRHPSLVDWADLSESDRMKDRNNVRAIPAILDLAGLVPVLWSGTPGDQS